VKARPVHPPLERLQAVVLMGGLGTRLHSISNGRPKAMMPVAGKPFFQHQLELMKWSGFRKFLFLVGWKADAVKAYFGDGSRFGVSIRYAADGPRSSGTGGALLGAVSRLKREFMLAYGDSYMDIDYAELACRYEAARRSDPRILGLMAVFKNAGRHGRSNVLFRDGRLLRYDKARPSAAMRHIDYGAAVLDKRALAYIPRAPVSDLADAYRRLSEAGRLAGFEVDVPYHEIGTPRALAETSRFLERRRAKTPAIFVDRDGTLNDLVWNEDAEQFDSPFKPSDLKLSRGAARGLRRLKARGYLLIGVTNQPGAAKGKTTLAGLYDVNDALQRLLGRRGASLDAMLMCPHHPTGSRETSEPELIGACACRKPKPGLVRSAARKWNIDFSRSFMVGDSHVDVQTARAAGLRSAFVGDFKCESCRALAGRGPDYVVSDLDEFSRRISRNAGAG
jgi:mannose-1-phosphate guanylyltransferase / phosphomannomutase